jgi:DNA-binding transcriptional LysR family regulator
MICIMREVNLAGIDLNLLPVLDALLRRRHVSRAAADVGLSQPAMSRAMARLRDLTGDPLLLRGRNGYALTAKAARLAPRLAVLLDGTAALLRDEPFDPGAVRRGIRIAAADSQTILFAPPLMARLACEAPGIDLGFEAYAPDLAERMETGRLDLAFALASTPLPPGALAEPLGQDRLALVMRRGHPDAGRDWTVADYGRVGHVTVSLMGDGRSDLDAVLAQSGVTRRIALTTPYFMAALATVSRTDFVTTVSHALATRFARRFDLVLKPPPVPQAALAMTVVWPLARKDDEALAWLRALLRETAADIFGDPVLRATPARAMP